MMSNGFPCLSRRQDYFYEVGSYDEGMEIWGGENLEMSFRVCMWCAPARHHQKDSADGGGEATGNMAPTGPACSGRITFEPYYHINGSGC